MHKMILVSPCLTKVHAVVKVPVKNAGMAEQSRRIRNAEDTGESPVAGPKIEE